MEKTSSSQLSSGLVFLMALTISATVANLYYNQPLLPSIGESLGISSGHLGFIPSATQLGYAAAILFISPLGDRFDRKLLIRFLSITLVFGSLATYFSSSLVPLVLASFVVGVSSNITQQLIPLAASLSTPEEKGRVIGSLMTGLTIGILVSRTISGAIAEHFGWQMVYLFAAALAVVFGLLLMKFLPHSTPTSNLPYPKLLMSMLSLFKQHALLRNATITGGLWFAAFNALWATLAIHVADAPFHYTAEQAGLFGVLGLAGISSAKIAGRLVNKYGSKLLISVGISLVIAGFVVFALFGDTLTGMIVGVLLVDFGVFGSQIPNQVRIFSIVPKAQSRINAVYMLGYYLFGALGSMFGVQVLSAMQWHGLTIFALILSGSALAYHQITSKKTV